MFTKIAVYIPSKPFFGSTVLLIPFFQNIRAQYPQAKILVFSTTPIINVLSKLFLFDEVFLYDEKKTGTTKKPLKEFQPDLIINFRANSERLNWVLLFSFGVKKIGFKSSAILSFIYHYKPIRNKKDYRVHDFLRLLENPFFKSHFGLQKVKDLATLEPALSFDLSNRLNICLMPGGGEGEHKRWGIQNFMDLSKLIKNKYPNAHFHYVVGSQEETDMKFLEANFDKPNFTVYMNAKIPHILQVIENCKITIANDCGPSHLAQMCGGNYIGVWGWGNQNPIERIAEWTLKTDKSFAILADKDQDIKTLQPEKVFAKTVEILNKK